MAPGPFQENIYKHWMYIPDEISKNSSHFNDHATQAPRVFVCEMYPQG